MNYKEIDLNEVIATQEKPLRRLLGAGISLEVDRFAEAVRLHADEGMIGQILVSLVDHARQFLTGGGKLLLRTEYIEVDEIHARIQPGARRGEFVRLTICDDGHGIAADELRNLFLKWPEQNSARAGSTLPLPLVVGIIKRLHGWIETSSHIGGGAVIGVYLPAATPVSAAMLESPWVSETILLVDDEVALRRMVKTVLERAGYHVIEANTGEQALALWEEHKKRVKLLLTDMVLPDGLTGRGLAQRMLAAKPDLKVIYTSGFDLEAEAQRDTEYGTIRFLHKPYDMRGLLEVIHLTLSPKESANLNRSRHKPAPAMALL